MMEKDWMVLAPLKKSLSWLTPSFLAVLFAWVCLMCLPNLAGNAVGGQNSGDGTLPITVFFLNDRLDPQISCDKVFPVTRTIRKTQAVAQAALEELLQGPTQGERGEGYRTSINEGVKIQKLVIQNDLAHADFNEMLELKVAGSCRVRSIRAQIEHTLTQFPTVKEVVISINGKTEDILQP